MSAFISSPCGKPHNTVFGIVFNTVSKKALYSISVNKILIICYLSYLQIKRKRVEEEG